MKRRLLVVVTGTLIVLLGFLAFWKLGVAGIRNWDEARHGVSAYEMTRTGDPIVTTYMYNPDYWNLKPPLSEYFQVLGYAIFGYNALGLRFFSALFWMLSALAACWFARKQIGAAASVAVLLCFAASTDPLLFHCARTGDADAYLFFATTVAVVAMMRFDGTESKWVYAACLAFAFGFLVKSWHAGIIALVVISSLILSKKGIRWLTVKHILVCLACALGPVLVWAAARCSRDGLKFFEEMIRVDLVNRSTTVLEEHYGTWTYYLSILMDDWGAKGAFVLALIGSILSEKNEANARIIRTGWLGFLIPLILFSCVKSKLYWYIMVAYPPLLILASLGVQTLAGCLKRKSSMWRLIGAVSLGLATLALGLGICINTIAVANIEPLAYETELANAAKGVEGQRSLYSYDGKWDQSTVLLMEWLGDFRPKWGGYDAWEKDEEGLLLYYDGTRIDDSGAEVPGMGYMLLSHSENIPSQP